MAVLPAAWVRGGCERRAQHCTAADLSCSETQRRQASHELRQQPVLPLWSLSNKDFHSPPISPHVPVATLQPPPRLLPPTAPHPPQQAAPLRPALPWHSTRLLPGCCWPLCWLPLCWWLEWTGLDRQRVSSRLQLHFASLWHQKAVTCVTQPNSGHQNTPVLHSTFDL